MGKSRSPLVIIFLTVFIDLVGFGIVIPILPLYGLQFGVSPRVIGLLVGVFSAMQFIFAPILGRLSDKYGRRPILLFSLIGTAVGFLMIGMAHTLWLLFLGRIIDGITGGNISIAQAYIADVTPPEKRSKSMGIIGAAFGLGFIFGPAIGGLMSYISPGAPFLFAAALSAANATALYFLLPESLSAENRAIARQSGSLTGIIKEAGNWRVVGVITTYFFATMAFALMTTIFSLFTNYRFGFDASHNGYVFAYIGLLGALIQGGLLGRLLSVVGEKGLAIGGITLMAVSMFVLPLTATLGGLLIASTIMAIGNSFTTPTLNGLGSKSVGQAWQGRVMGVLQSSASLARFIGPPLGGWLLSYDAEHNVAHYGRTPLWTGGLIMVVAFILALTLQSARSPATHSAMSLESTD